MIKFQNWYAVVWSVVLLLYSLGWSQLNFELNTGLLIFFLATIICSIGLGALAKPVVVRKLKWVTGRRPTITIVLALGFILDWAYQGNIPMLRQYRGFDVTLEIQQTVGIPGFHVLITSVAIFYAMYLAYVVICDSKNRQYVAEFSVMLIAFLLNNSRGYLIFAAIVFLITYLLFNGKTVRELRISTVCGALLICASILLVMSFLGNVRSGYAWYDCSYIEQIGVYVNYPWWLSKHFMWSYTYITSPLANLNLIVSVSGQANNLSALAYSFLPEAISKYYLAESINAFYLVDYLNACTGFAPFALSYGLVGLYAAYVVQFILFAFIKKILARFEVLETFGNIVLCMCVLLFTFFNTFSTSALCFMPIYLITASFFLSRQQKKGILTLVSTSFDHVVVEENYDNGLQLS